MKMSKVFKRLLSLTLVACLIFSNLSFADTVNESNSSTEETVEESKATSVETEVASTEVVESETTEEETTEKKVAEEEIKEETEVASGEDTTRDRNEAVEEETATDSEIATEEETETATESEIAAEEETEATVETTVEVESIVEEESLTASASEVSEVTVEEIILATISEAEIATGSEAVLGDPGYDPSSHYDVVFHFVMPNDATSRGSSWRNTFGATERFRIYERRYYTGHVYDETIEVPNAITPAEEGVLFNVDLWDILKGYELVGWNTNEAAAKAGTKQYELSPAGTTPLSTEKNVTIDLYSVFELIPITIKFNVNDRSKGTGSTDANRTTFTSQTVHLGDELSFFNNSEYTNVSRPGYDFIGWSKYQYNGQWRNLGPSENGVEHDNIILVNPTEKFSLASVVHTDGATIRRGDSYTFYAVWNPHVYKTYIHWPQFTKGASYTYQDYVNGCKNAAPYEQWLIFDNDFEIIQELNTMKNLVAPNRMRVAACIPLDYFLGLGQDPTCEDTSKVIWDANNSFWGEIIPDGEEWHLYCILTPSVYTQRVNVRVNLDGGYHRYQLDYRSRVPANVSYRQSLYPQLMSNLTKPGYTVDKIVKVDSNGNETDFDFDSIATVADKSEASLQRLADYEKYTAEAEPLYDAYFEAMRLRKELQNQYIPEDGSGISWEEFEQIPEAAALLKDERAKYAAYKEVADKIPDSQDTWDLYLKVKWKGKPLEGIFEYHGNKGNSYKVDPTTMTMTSKTVVYGEPIGNLPTPKKTGFIFKGWKTGRTLHNQSAWKSVTSSTVFDSAETNEPFVFGYSYDELPFRFYADWEGIPLHLKPQGGEHPEANVTINSFKFGEETTLNIQGSYNPNSFSARLFGGNLFGGGEEQEAYGIEILEDYTTDGDTPTKVQVAGTQYENGQKVTLYAGNDGNLNIKPLWRSKNNTNNNNTNNNNTNNNNTNNNNTNNNNTPTNNTPTNNNNNSDSSSDRSDPTQGPMGDLTKDNNNNNNTPTNNTPTNNTPTNNTPTNYTPTNTTPTNNTPTNYTPTNNTPTNNTPTNTTPTNNNTTNITPVSITPVNSNNNPSGGPGGGGTTGSKITANPLANNQNLLQNKAAEPKPQQTLQQTISSGSFAKSTVNTKNLEVKTLLQGTNTWAVNPTTGKYKLSGVTALGQVVSANNCFAQVSWTMTDDKQKQVTITDTYYFDTNGDMVTGWMQTEDGKWYFFDDTKGANEGKMSLGWTQIAGSWYYFTSNGSMLVNGTTPDGLKVNSDGIWSQA